MKAKLTLLHEELITELERMTQPALPEVQQVENCYLLTMNYWTKAKEIFKSRVLYDEEEEIEFFKSIKPSFTAYAEYYLILNQAILFCPTEPEEQIYYWGEELKRYQRYCQKHADLIRYNESYSSEYDAAYFLIRNNRQELPPQERIYEDEDCRSSHDHIVRGLLANKMYYEYANRKLEELTSKTA